MCALLPDCPYVLGSVLPPGCRYVFGLALLRDCLYVFAHCSCDGRRLGVFVVGFRGNLIGSSSSGAQEEALTEVCLYGKGILSDT